MTVKELIDKLSNYPSDWKVEVPEYVDQYYLKYSEPAIEEPGDDHPESLVII